MQAAEAVGKQRDANVREQRLRAELAAAAAALSSSQPLMAGPSAPSALQLPDLSAHGSSALCSEVRDALRALAGWQGSAMESWAPQLQHLALILATGEATNPRRA